MTESAATLSVSLDAQLSKTVFQMGGGTPYKSWVEPGAKSPTCGSAQILRGEDDNASVLLGHAVLE